MCSNVFHRLLAARLSRSSKIDTMSRMIDLTSNTVIDNTRDSLAHDADAFLDAMIDVETVVLDRGCCPLLVLLRSSLRQWEIRAGKKPTADVLPVFCNLNLGQLMLLCHEACVAHPSHETAIFGDPSVHSMPFNIFMAQNYSP